MADGQVTRETLELVMALRPFTGARGQRLIDTLVEITQGGNVAESLEISAMTGKAQNLLAERLDSAVSLSLILAASWFGEKLESYIAKKASQSNG